MERFDPYFVEILSNWAKNSQKSTEVAKSKIYFWQIFYSQNNETGNAVDFTENSQFGTLSIDEEINRSVYCVMYKIKMSNFTLKMSSIHRQKKS